LVLVPGDLLLGQLEKAWCLNGGISSYPRLSFPDIDKERQKRATIPSRRFNQSGVLCLVRPYYQGNPGAPRYALSQLPAKSEQFRRFRN
jgi:hypothetical protein